MRLDLFARDSNPYGRPFSYWTMYWWKWLLSIPRKDNPAYDYTGEKALTNQKNSNVIFLCQTIEGSQVIPIRKIRGVLDKPILIPVINWISIQHEDGETDDELVESAKQRMNVVGSMDVRINGEKVEMDLFQFRVQSPIFEMFFQEDNVLDVERGSRRLVSDGYWLFVKSTHLIRYLESYATCTSGKTRIRTSYTVGIATPNSPISHEAP